MDRKNVERCVEVSKGSRWSEEVGGVVHQLPEKSTDRVALRGQIFTDRPELCKELKALLIRELSDTFTKLEALGFEFNEIRESQVIYPEAI